MLVERCIAVTLLVALLAIGCSPHVPRHAPAPPPSKAMPIEEPAPLEQHTPTPPRPLRESREKPEPVTYRDRHRREHRLRHPNRKQIPPRALLLPPQVQECHAALPSQVRRIRTVLSLRTTALNLDGVTTAGGTYRSSAREKRAAAPRAT